MVDTICDKNGLDQLWHRKPDSKTTVHLHGIVEKCMERSMSSSYSVIISLEDAFITGYTARPVCEGYECVILFVRIQVAPKQCYTTNKVFYPTSRTYCIQGSAKINLILNHSDVVVKTKNIKEDGKKLVFEDEHLNKFVKWKNLTTTNPKNLSKETYVICRDCGRSNEDHVFTIHGRIIPISASQHAEIDKTHKKHLMTEICQVTPISYVCILCLQIVIFCCFLL